MLVLWGDKLWVKKRSESNPKRQEPFPIAAQFWGQISVNYLHPHHRFAFSEASLLWTSCFHNQCSQMRSKPLLLSSSTDWANKHSDTSWSLTGIAEDIESITGKGGKTQAPFSPTQYWCSELCGLVPGKKEQMKLGRDPDHSFITSQLLTNRGPSLFHLVSQ